MDRPGVKGVTGVAGRRVVWISLEVLVTVGLAGLLTNVASSRLPGWVSEPWVVFPALGAVLAGMVVLTVRRQGAVRPDSPPVWNAPSRNPHFIGRAVDLQRLRGLLRGRSTVTVHAVRGMGGVGKTQLALEYVHRYASEFELIWWISAEEPALIPDQLGRLAVVMGLPVPSGDAEALVSVVISELHRRNRWLLVFDNAESVEAVRRFVPSGDGRVLITTRRSGFDALGDVLHLTVMTRAESVELLRTRAPIMSSAQADELAELVGDLPLALEQAAAFLALSPIPVPEFLSVIRRRVEAMLDKGRDHHRGYEAQTVAALWELSFAQIERSRPAAAQLLILCGYFSPDAIPLDLFTGNPSTVPAPLADCAAAPLEFADTAGVLIDYSLAHGTDNRSELVVHRLVQAAIRRHVDDSQLSGHGPGVEEHPLIATARLLRADLPGDIRRRPQSWPRWRQLLPHVLTVVGRHEEQSPHAAPVDTAWLLDRAATYLREHGQAADAIPLFERALATLEAVRGPDHPQVATSLNGLGGTLRDLGRAGEALPVFERALAINEANHGPDHADVAFSLNGLAISLRDLGRATDAKPLFERALAIDEAIHGPDHPDVAMRLMGLAVTLYDLGLVADAVPLFERALAITESTRGPNHPDVAFGLNNLAGPLRRLGRYADAKPLLERAVAIDEAAYGPHHPQVSLSLDNLASTLRDLGQAADAIPLLEQALTITEGVYGQEHPDVASRLDNLALAWLDLGQAADAKPLLERALAINEGVYGPDHPDVARSLNNLALALCGLGKPASARPLYGRALAIAETTYGPDHSRTQLYRRNLDAMDA